MDHPQSTFRNTTFTGKTILATRRNTVAQVTLKTQLDQFKTTGRYNCFELQWHPIYNDKSPWPVPMHLFWDSDIAKWIESACYFLASHYDKGIDEAVQYMVGTIRSAQQEDGYINVHYTVVDRKGRWSNLRDMHELYNCGHLIEAALAHKYYYKNNLLLDPMIRYVRLIDSLFGPEDNKIHGYPGHPEIELALLRLWGETGEQCAYRLAKYFVEERGNPTGQDGKHFYDWEAEQRRESPWKRPDPYPEAGSHWYNQSHVPIVDQETIEGHSVRALYLLTAVSDLLCIEQAEGPTIKQSDRYKMSLQRQWNNMVDKKMYVTGGVGAIRHWEGFGIDYFLPQSTDEGGCYAETCASIAVMFLAERMLKLDLDGRYGDIMELCLYNNVMTAMSLDGKAFTYVNQLGSSEKDKSGREDWFWCACCPPNFSRLFGSLGGYLWHFGAEKIGAFINIHLYTSATLKFETSPGTVELEMKSNWPWEGQVFFALRSPGRIRLTTRLRIPAWASGGFSLEPAPMSVAMQRGYLVLGPEYVQANPNFTLSIHGFEPRYIEPDPYTNQNTVTLARGPIIYCIEDAQNAWATNHFKDVVLTAGESVREQKETHKSSGETYIALHTTVRTRSLDSWKTKRPGTDPSVSSHKVDLTSTHHAAFIPYYLRANSGGNGQMRVGLIKG
ncbi:glycoside hydrolase family 127 protein [Plenodomus tracheiphilus IPT5]|uniref:Glycoside hydrolase family 127 protein n=1 Tax=Plenodomus tracheiphilus IPT5 TaxID=1408161 RepID=A0A6A7BFG7_9PLEO|nr:glycoside hydrolase family 127 protein [Plenodomus tracheiphilus IPT5]